MYLTRTWNDILSCTKTNLYGTQAVSLPIAESYVVFTGNRQNKPETLSLREIYFQNDNCELDFKVRCIYKKEGGNDIIQQYIAFANMWDKQSRRFNKDHQMDALRETIDQCIALGILTNFLTRRRAEIMDIYTALFDQDEVTRRTNLEIWNEGKDEGDKEASIRIAKSFKEANTPPEVIAQCTGLSLEQIEKL